MSNLFYYIFTKNAFTKKFVWFDNFKLAMKNMGKFTVLAVPLTMAIFLILALLLVRFATRLPFVKSALLLPVILPSATIVMLWNAYISTFTPFHSLLLIFLWKYGGLNVMLMLTALSGIDKSMIEAAGLDTGSILKIILHIIVPTICPGSICAWVLSFTEKWNAVAEPIILMEIREKYPLVILMNEILPGDVLGFAARSCSSLPRCCCSRSLRMKSWKDWGITG